MSERQLRYPERVAVARLHALLELLPTALDKRMQPAGLTSFEFTLLEALAEADGGKLRLSALASRTNATLARLSRVVTGLERKGLVRRAPCPEDARATNAVLTDQGRQVYRDGTGLYADAVSSMILDGLSEGDVDDLARLAFAILTRLDPDRRLAVTAATSGATASGAPVAGLSAAGDDCPADPAAPDEEPCAADPVAPDAVVRELDPADLAAPAALAGLVPNGASADPAAVVDPEQLAAEACPAGPPRPRP
ncbi:MarR family winged helix-turn-helix transcriptional regulator [Promicromonospora sukumoe]|uniref:MarR family winged helix-turn-helix transcriptional regulator n=1 Tax=Promicromonospora sukumoe TaxID=88382 RepID=UPI00037431F4|nr:MarR family winged helix-turn-helix transcriptional regulator [Promicromonospora sukumoe]